MNPFQIKPPCHPEATLMVDLAWEGPAYLQSQVLDGFWCTAPGCYNTWDAEGNPTY